MLPEYYKEKLILFNKSSKVEVTALSLFITNNSFIYTLSSNNYKDIYQIVHVTFDSYLTTKHNLCEKVSFLVTNYQLASIKVETISITILTKDFTLVPESYSSQSDIKDFLIFSTGNSEIKNAQQHTVKNVKFCYSIEQSLFQYLEKTFNKANIRHSGAINSDLFFSSHSLLKNNLFLNINDGVIELVAKENNELLFYNVFNFENNEDILYYLLFMMEQFKLNPLHTKLAIAGQIETNDALILSIKKYIKQVYFAINSSEIKLEGELSNLPQHYYFSLLNQHLCVL
jgi:hypothetical protein